MKRCYRWLATGGILSYSDQFSGTTDDIYQRHLEHWKRFADSMNTSASEWQMWMEHQAAHDFHDPLPDQLDWLRAAGFRPVDCPWRYLLWTVVQARKPEQPPVSNGNHE